MKVSREQVAEHRQKILDAAARLFRDRGYDGVTVAEIMGAAGLTHGGFYGHFDSKEDLIAQTLAHLLPGKRADESLAELRARYLSTRHRDDRANGCPVAALGAETVRQPPAARTVMTAGLRRQLERLSATSPGTTDEQRRQAATGNWATMVGALVLSRLADDPALADQILRDTRAWLDRTDAAPAKSARRKPAS